MNSPIAAHWIAGEWITEGEIKHTIDATSGEQHKPFHFGDGDIARRAIGTAREVFEQSSWAHSPRLRSQVLFEIADAIESCGEEIAHTNAIESGKVIHHCVAEMRAAVSECRYYGGLARGIFGRVAEIEEGGQSIFTREAIGVAGIIVPWNAPSTLLVRSLAPALAAGCTAVLKGAHQTATVTNLLAQCLANCPSLPAGVVNIVQGDLEVSKVLCTDIDVDVVSFTGSSATGKSIMQSAAPTLKRLSLELGGKSPAVVFADADMQRATREVSAGIIPHCGQMCTAISRVLVEESAWSQFVPHLVAALQSKKIGRPLDHNNDMGPLLNPESADRYETNIAQAGDIGETILAGARLTGDWPRENFVSPALYRIDNPSHHLVQEELFAPIGMLETFKSEEEAVVSANATRYGLAASLYTADESRSKRVARAIKSGTVWVNCHNRLFAEAETGGYRESGLGRLHGLEGLSPFMETKHIYSEFGRVSS